jgi:hypothetical protein
MDIYLNTVMYKDLKQIALSDNRKKDKYKIKKMCKNDLVEFIIDKKILDISNLDNMRSTDLDYFIDYNQLQISRRNTRFYKYYEILESKKFNLYLNIEQNEYIENTLSMFLLTDLINIITGYNTHYCTNAQNCDTIVPNKCRKMCKVLEQIYKASDSHHCCNCMYNYINHINYIPIFIHSIRYCSYCIKNPCNYMK